MDLTELTNTLKEKIAGKDKLEQEKKQLEQSLADELRHNYEAIFLPEYKKLVEMDELLRKATRKDFCTTVSNESQFFYAPACYSANGLHYKNILVGLVCDNTDCICNFSKVFLNADTTLAFLEEVKAEVFMTRFKAYETYLDKQTEFLRDSIATLLDKMSSASSVKENDDGTIEITLNGKTYVGYVRAK